MPTVCSHSIAGGHLENEDALGVVAHPQDGQALIVALADGQGGRAGGQRAARLACDLTLRAASQHPIRRLMTPSVWSDIMREVDLALRDDPQAGYTTLIGFAIAGGFIAGASSGDSAVLLVSAGAAQPVELTARQRKNPPTGSGAACFEPFGTVLIEPWTVLAMSDGVFKYAGWPRVRESAVRLTGHPLIADLISAAKLPQSQQLQDDFSVIVLSA